VGEPPVRHRHEEDEEEEVGPAYQEDEG
jgi:hypothetical protein